MDIAIGNKNSTGQIGPRFEPVNGCLLKSTGATCEGDEKREGARDAAEGLRGAHQTWWASRLPPSPETGPGSGQVCCLPNALDL